MSAPLRKLASMILARVPAVLTFAVLGGVLWWGYRFDWKIPRFPVLLGHKESAAEEKKKEESEDAGKDKPSSRTIVVRVTLENEDKDSEESLPSLDFTSEEILKRVGVRSDIIESREVGEYVTGHGEIAFNQDHYAHLSALASGKASIIYKHEGDQVKEGEVLALIACPEVARLKFDLQQTLLLVQIRKRLYQRLKSTKSSTSGQILDNAEKDLRDAKLRLSGNQQALEDLGLSLDLEKLASLSDERIAARLRTLGIPDSLLQGKEARKRTSNLLPMYAPFDGVVVQRDIVEGEIVNLTTPQFVLADLSHLWIMLHVPMENAHKLHYGQDVFFHLDGADVDAPKATIKWVSPEVDLKTRSVVVRAEVPNPPDVKLRPRTFGTARILIGRYKRTVVPNAALQFDGKSQIVFMQKETPTTFQPVRVQLGPRHEKFTEIVSGVEAGQTIATAGTHVLLSVMQKGRIGGDD